MKFLLIGLGILFLLFLMMLIWLLFPENGLWSSSNKIGVIEVRGLISDVRNHLEDIKKFRKDKKIKAIVLRIESPGGGVGPSQELYREITRTIPNKPIIASLGGVAASGGYYIASAASHIVANPGTVTGSIGVLFPFQNFQGFFEKVGYKKIFIKSGEFKDVGNPGREMTSQEKEVLQETVDAVHLQFVRAVAQGRSLSEENVLKIADGRIITGQMAQELDLVDELGNFEDAVNAAKKLGKVEGEPTLVYARKRKYSLIDLLLGNEWNDKIKTYLDSSWDLLRYQIAY